MQRCGWLSAADAELLLQGRHVLSAAAADKIIENVIGVFGMPLAIAPNFIVNGHDCIVPMVVEEPSIVAGVSSAARLARATGGFEASCAESLLAGQVHITGMPDVEAALQSLASGRTELLALANSIHPRLAERGGGVRDIALRHLTLGDGSPLIAVDLLVDTCDAMGANLVNTICEAVAPRIAELGAGDVALRILSNLADRSLVTARVRFRLDDLAAAGFEAASVRDGIVLASDIAGADPYRAATHNKGIMNGVDAVAIATGNDWRAIEAGAHAFAAHGGQYGPLATWSADASGDLVGEICLPLKVGTVGGGIGANTAAAMGLRISGVGSARELAELMAAVGLAQNFAALKALATSGIQEGHMKLHARSVASAAGVPDELFGDVVDALIADGTIKTWKAHKILAGLRAGSADDNSPCGKAAGKVILLGEHAVVYGKHALAIPIADAVSARVAPSDTGLSVSVPAWGVYEIVGDQPTGIGEAVSLIVRELDLPGSGYSIVLRSRLPRAMGLGASAAFAVAIVRAFDVALELGLDDERVNAIAFACEKLAHGTPSGVDNAIATYGTPMLFRNAGKLEAETLTLSEPPPVVIACSSQRGLTRDVVAGVRARRERSIGRYDTLFEEIDALSRAGAAALLKADYAELGALMNICHGLLNAIEVSTAELESMVSIARAAGATGAKLTGAGGGGSMVALCPGSEKDVAGALESAGFVTLSFDG
jgi:hydroxymethylglutaryl-CoA reductase